MSRFGPIVKLHAQKVKELQNEIALANTKIAELEEAAQSAHSRLLATTTPKGGSFYEMIKANEIKKAKKMELQELEAHVQHCRENLQSLQQAYKERSIELEKAKHLQAVEVKELLQKRKVAERNELDEISMMLYNNKERKE